MIHNKNIVDDIFLDCMSKKDSSDNQIIVTGIAHQFRLDTNKLEEHKEEIVNFLDTIIAEGETINFYHLCENKNGENWGTFYESELLLVLGRAMNLIDFAKDTKLTRKDPFGLPFVTRIKNKMDISLVKKQ